MISMISMGDMIDCHMAERCASVTITFSTAIFVAFLSLPRGDGLNHVMFL